MINQSGTRFAILLLLVAFLAVTMAACGIYEDVRASTNRNRLNDLQIGITQEQVNLVMGRHWKKESYLQNSTIYEVLYYQTQSIQNYGTTDEEMTPVVLKDGKVVGWGRKFFADLRIEIHENSGDNENRLR